MAQHPFSLGRIDGVDRDARMDEDVIADVGLGNQFEADLAAQTIELDDASRQLACVGRTSFDHATGDAETHDYRSFAWRSQRAMPIASCPTASPPSLGGTW